MKLKNLKRITSKIILKKIKNDTSLIWNRIQQLITLKHKSNRQPSIITVKSKDANPKNVANDFNNFFTNIGPILNFLNKSTLNSFVRKPVTYNEVRNLIS